MALCQLAVTDDKQRNIATARSAIDEAAGAGGEAGPAVVSLSSAAGTILLADWLFVCETLSDHIP